jgi:PAS domain S-box-containing protein
VPPRELPLPLSIATGAAVQPARYELVLPDGRTVQALGGAVPLRDGAGAGVRGALALAVDVAALQPEAETSDAREERFRRLADAVPSFVWTAAPDGTITFANRRWHEYSGLTPEQTARDWAQALHPDDVAPCTAAWTAALEGGTDYEMRLRNRARDGSYRWFLARALPVRDAEGRVTGWFGTSTDVHEQVLAEEALRESRERLRRSEEELRLADRRKNEFLAVLGHELRNPLGPIRNAVFALRRLTPADPRLEPLLAIVERQASHVARLVDDLLDVSRIARGGVRLRKETLDLTELVRRAAEDYRGTLEELGIRFEVDAPPGPLRTSGDPTRISQLLGNVLHNAGKFTPAGGRVSLRLSPEPGGRAAVLEVADTGVGMDRDTLARLFEGFTGPAGEERNAEGLGLGLTVVRGLVELHGGSVAAESDGPGRGSRILIRLPLIDRARAEGPDPAPHPAASPGRRVLVIDDNEDGAESLRLLLEASGHRVEVAHDGRTGLELARRFAPDVVLCDIGLADGPSGYDVARALRSDAAAAGACLVALTGYGQEEDLRRAKEAGFDLHRTKPIDPAELQRLVAGAGAS